VSELGLNVAGEEMMSGIVEIDHLAQRGAYTTHQAIKALRSPQVRRRGGVKPFMGRSPLGCAVLVRLARWRG
jgi:hypothetical protein